MRKSQQNILVLVESDDIGSALRALREEARLTQAELAVYIGVAPSTVYRWESGQGEPTVGQAKRIADVLMGNWPKASNLSPSQPDDDFRLARERLVELIGRGLPTPSVFDGLVPA